MKVCHAPPSLISSWDIGALAKYSYLLVESLSPTFEVEHFLNCELESESEASWYGIGLPIHRL